MASVTYGELLRNKGIRAFLWTQFLGAFNDNVFKFIVSMAAIAAATGSAASDELSWVGAVFTAPFLLFSGYAGQLSDRYDKRTVLVATKALEIVSMALALAALTIGGGNLNLLLVVLFLMAAQATFFSPAKYGIVPEVLPDAALSRANGLLEMSTFAAIVVGSTVGGLMYASWHHKPLLMGATLLAIAVAGTWTSFGIPRGTGGRPDLRVQLNPFAGLGNGLHELRKNRALLLAALGIGYFWFIGALLQLVILLAGKESMHLDDVRIALMGAWLAIGIGVGSMAAGRLSGQKVELGLAPIGAFGMGFGALALSKAIPSYPVVCGTLTVLGFAGGLFAVPLNALIQQRPDEKEKGQVIATANLMTTIGVMVASGALWALGSVMHLSPERIILLAGILTLVSSVYVLALVPEYFVRFSLWLLTHTVYRIRIVGQDHVPFRGPALLVSNHLSHVDGFLIGASVQRFVRFMVWRPFFEMPLFNPMLRFMHAIPVSASRHDVVASLEKARAELEAGHVVCIFAEGAISRTGNLLPFKRGFERIVQDLDVPVIPVNLDRVWGSVFSFKRGRFFWKRPERLPYPVTVTFGPPLPSSSKAADVRQAVMALASEAMTTRIERGDLLHLRFLHTAKHRWSALAMADATGTELTFGRVLVGSLMLSRWIRKHPGSERMIGLMLPSSIGGALANIGALIAGRVPVNLNFTAGPESIAAAIDQCGIKTILTSKVFLAKANLPELPGMVYLEDVMRTFSTPQKVLTLIAARLLPSGVLRRLYARDRATSDDLATVIFSSGSTGKPKGVMLSHRNVLSNLEGMIQMFPVDSHDRMIGVLPFFHSFGFTGTLWFPMVAGFGALYVPNPMDAKAVGQLAGKYGGTMLIGTPTFYTAYIRKCSPEEFKTLRYAIVGAEKLREPIARAFKEKFGLDIIEGYGCTELSPVVSANYPDGPEGQVGRKPGTVGHPLPGIVVRVVDPDTGAPRGVNEPGLLLVKGPNLMMGYLNNPSLTAEVLRDGWYVTGDVGAVDEDGFITLTDQLSRFSKIAGEMVPHQKIEEVASALLDDPNAVVTSVADESRGERLVLLYTKADVRPEQLWAMLNDSELPKLWIPKRDNIYLIDAIPVLGTGKIDLRAVKTLAAAKTEAAGSPTA